MKTYIYKGGFNIVKQSGVGKAMEHQEGMLRAADMPVARTWKEASVIHINTVFPDSVLAAVLAHLQHKKVVYYGHSTMEDFRNSFKGSNLFASLFKKWICFCYRKGDVILTPTGYSRRLLLSYGIHKPVYNITNGIDTDFFRPEKTYGERFRKKYHIAAEQKVVISAGHYIDRKGIREFLQIARRMPEIRFIWFGGNAQMLLTREIKRALNEVPPNVLLPGFVSSDEIRDACCGADVFLFLSHEETEGIAVLEALACGAPVLLRDIPVYENWLRDGKQVRKAKNSVEFVSKLREMLKEKPRRLSEEGRKLALSYNMDHSGQKLKKIYRLEGCLDG